MKRFTTYFLAVSVLASGIMMSSCSDNNSSRNRHHDDDEEKTSETTIEATEETSIETTEAQETSETFSSESTGATLVMPDTSDISTCNNPSNINDSQAYEAFMGFINQYAPDHPGAKYGFYSYCYMDDSGYLSRWGLAVTENNNTSYYAVDNSSVVVLDHESDEDFQTGYLTSDEIGNLPVMCEVDIYSADASYFVSVPDGEYFGGIHAVRCDGSSVIIAVGDPIYIDEATYSTIQTSDSFTDINGENYTIDERYDENGFSAIDGAGSSVYGWFVPSGDGLYIMSSESDCTVYHHTRLTQLNLSQDCTITDNYGFLTGINPEDVDPYGPVDTSLPHTLTNTYFYYYYASYDYSNYYNGWMTVHGLLEPVEVQNGVITSINLGWR